MKKFLAMFGVFLLPVVAEAHTRWFAYRDLAPLDTTGEPTNLYIGTWAAIILTIALIGLLLHRHDLFRFDFLRPKRKKAFERAASTFTMIAGAFFLIAGTHEYLFSPNLAVDLGLPMWLIFIQIVIGLAFLVGILTRVFALVLIALWAFAWVYVGTIATLENIWVLSTGIFILVMGNDYFSIISSEHLKDTFSPLRKYAMSILRLGTGLTLMVLGLSEKLLAPEFGVNFLAQHEWNFMQTIGYDYSDYLFTISAGSVEFLFGLIFVMGVVTRLNALVVAVVFSTPLFILGPIELAGHLPHFAAVVLLLLYGNGGHFIVGRTKKDKKIGEA